MKIPVSGKGVPICFLSAFVPFGFASVALILLCFLFWNLVEEFCLMTGTGFSCKKSSCREGTGALGRSGRDQITKKVRGLGGPGIETKPI